MADAEIEAFEATLREASPRLERAARRSSDAARAAATLGDGPEARSKRALAAEALGAEREEVLALRARLKRLPATSTRARTARTNALEGLRLLASSLDARREAVVARPAARARLLRTSERLLLRSVEMFAASARLMSGA